MKKDDFRFVHRLRVRWSEVDMQQIVFNAHYAMYMDTAIGDYWRHLALPYEDTMRALNGDIFLKKTTVEFHASARYDDALAVGLRCARVGRSSMVFEGGVFLGDQLLTQGEMIYVFANPQTHTSLPVPDPLLQWMPAGLPRACASMKRWNSRRPGNATPCTPRTRLRALRPVHRWRMTSSSVP